MERSTYEKKSLTLETSNRIISAAEKKAREIGVPMCVAVLDEGGNLKAFSRMDGAALSGIGLAQDKAYSAVGFGMATDAWYSLIKDDPPMLTGAPHIPRFVLFGGGYPIKIGNEVVGGIGVSGGHYTQDMNVANAGLEVLK